MEITFLFLSEEAEEQDSPKYTADRKYYFVTFPKGLFGVLKMIAFVFGLKAASNSLGSIFQPVAERQLSSDYEMSD